MSERVYAWYAGCKAMPAGREYRFLVENGEEAPLEFQMTITDTAWLSNHARLPDGPAICGRRLRRELAARSHHSPVTYCLITRQELEEYSHGTL